MKKKYANTDKENDKNAQNVNNEVISYSEPIEGANAREAVPSVKTKAKPVRMEEQPKQLSARELLEASYNEIRKSQKRSTY